MSVAIINTTPPLSEGGSLILANQGYGKALVFSTPEDNDSQITSIELGLNKADGQNYPQTYNISLSLWSVNSSGIPSQQIGASFTENVTLNASRTTYSFTGFNPGLTSGSTYALLVSNNGANNFKWANTNVDLDTEPVGQNGFNYRTMWIYNPTTGEYQSPGQAKFNAIIMNVNIGPSKGRYSLGPMPTGNVNEHTGIEISTSGYFNGRGTFTVSDPIQTGNNYVKPGEYGELVLDSQTGYYHYIPDFNKIAELKTGEIAIDEFTINLSATNGTTSSGQYRVELIGYSDSEAPPQESSTDSAPNTYRIAEYLRKDKRPDPITGFRAGIDKLAFDLASLEPTSELKIKNTENLNQYKKLQESDTDLIVLHKKSKIFLEWNQNGVHTGLGKGGLIAIIEESMPYSINHDDFVHMPVFGQQNFV